MTGKLILADGTQIEGDPFGFEQSAAGEVVFSTGMVGYPESLTDPSYNGQILVLTYPIIGNYGVPDKKYWESDRIRIKGLIVSNYIDTPSHHQSVKTLKQWLLAEKIPALEIKDTRFLAMKIREQGTMLGKIIIGQPIEYFDPNTQNLVAQVSIKSPVIIRPDKNSINNPLKTVALFDCGAKINIERNLLKRGISVLKVPWNYDVFESSHEFDAIVISNGPGDPKMARETIAILKKALDLKIPILGICLGNQILTLAAGGDTYKLKFGHRSQNQPCLLTNSNRCYITTQNHGFAVGDIPKGFEPWFTNANDNTNEGIIHNKYPWMSVQFHPESTPGPYDTEWIFDYFLNEVKKRMQ
jgi:carbamoyl-phosphate synthase small subunit